MPENNMKIIIREMQPEDVSAVAALEAECFSEPWSEQAFLDALKQSEAMMMVAVGRGNNQMGYCGIYLSADEGEITNVAVRPDYRKQGFMQKCIDYSQALDYDFLCLVPAEAYLFDV